MISLLNNSDAAMLEKLLIWRSSIVWRPVISRFDSTNSLNSYKFTPSSTKDSSSKKSSSINARASASINSFKSSSSTFDLDLISAFKTSVSFRIWNVSSSSIISLTSFTFIFLIASSNSSGNASPEERPRSPSSSFDARSSLEVETISSKEIFPDLICS